MTPNHEMDPLDDVVKAWDSNPWLRDRLRTGKPLVHELTGTNCNVKTCVLNRGLLTPLLYEMQKTASNKSKLGKLPEIERVRASIKKIYFANNASIDLNEVVILSWHIRKHLVLVKRKAGRAEVSKDRFSVLLLRHRFASIVAC